ncbi:cation diffusion facilitator family transporter [Vampirovibrio chlorellavorus]|uniref:cation diffusion facilitator family transporter n=1 Tax=Vampirovibrio chlorellavorus TaxID=758823 RepID=UPI0026EE0A91|nr:cation diffusion facilitator family transporter [Vampirovibrio chlorellavorus]
MSNDCHHGRQHIRHHHHHIGVAEGLSVQHVKKLQAVMVLSVLYLLLQAAGGFYSGSLALWADAGHKLADIGAIALALAASWFANLSSSPQKTFGFYRLEILAAFVNAAGLMVVSLLIFAEALQRLLHPGEGHVHGHIMVGVAGLGFLINVISALVLYPSRSYNLNVKGALLHVMTDIANSVGEMLAAGVILWFGWLWADALIGIAISLMVLVNAGRVLREALNILMEAAPPRLSVPHIHDFILRHPGVQDVHDLHVWTVTTGKEALLAHVQVDEAHFHDETAKALEHELREAFDLCHITVQLEPPGFEEALLPF